MHKKILLYLTFISLIASCITHKKYSLATSYPPDQDTIRYIPYRKGDTWFFIDRQQEGPYAGYAKAWEQEWDYICPFDEYGLSLVGKNNLYGWMNNKGELITPMIYQKHNRSFSSGKGYAVMRDTLERSVLMNRHGKIIASVRKGFRFHGQVVHGCIMVHDEIGKTAGLIDTTGYWRIPLGKYKYIASKSADDTSDVYVYSLPSETTFTKSKKGFIRNDGTLITDTLFNSTGYIAYGVCPVKFEEGRNGLYNVYTKQLVMDSCKFHIYNFNSGVSSIRKNYFSGYGLINTAGKLVIPYKYEDIEITDDPGFVLAKKEDKWGVVSYKTGEETSEFIYDKYAYKCLQWGMYVFSKDDKSGVIDPWGNIILPFEYDVDKDKIPQIKSLSPNLLSVRKNGRWLLVNRQNEIVVPPMSYQKFGNWDKLTHGLIEIDEIDDWGRSKRFLGFMDTKGNTYWEDDTLALKLNKKGFVRKIKNSDIYSTRVYYDRIRIEDEQIHILRFDKDFEPIWCNETTFQFKEIVLEVKKELEEWSSQKLSEQELYSFFHSLNNNHKDSIPVPLLFIRFDDFLPKEPKRIDEKGTYRSSENKSVDCNVYVFAGITKGIASEARYEGFSMFGKDIGWCYTEYEFNENGDKYIHELTETLTLEEFEALKSKAYNKVKTEHGRGSTSTLSF